MCTYFVRYLRESVMHWNSYKNMLLEDWLYCRGENLPVLLLNASKCSSQWRLIYFNFVPLQEESFFTVTHYYTSENNNLIIHNQHLPKQSSLLGLQHIEYTKLLSIQISLLSKKAWKNISFIKLFTGLRYSSFMNN